MAACITLNDASRAISTYRDAESLKIQPNLETYNLLLHAAQKVGHKDLAMYILSDLKKAQITPNADTYASIILTCLTQPTGEYDQAFLYLEEMKAAGFKPRSGLYASFVKKCVYHSDERALTVIDEMKKLGYATGLLETHIRRSAQFGKFGSASRFGGNGESFYGLKREEGREAANITSEILARRQKLSSGQTSVADIFDL
jgi:hypothetical protein